MEASGHIPPREDQTYWHMCVGVVAVYDIGLDTKGGKWTVWSGPSVFFMSCLLTFICKYCSTVEEVWALVWLDQRHLCKNNATHTHTLVTYPTSAIPKPPAQYQSLSHLVPGHTERTVYLMKIVLFHLFSKDFEKLQDFISCIILLYVQILKHVKALIFGHVICNH